MVYLTVHRFDGNLAICVDKDKQLFGIEKNELPEGTGISDTIVIDNDGNISLQKKTDTKKGRK